MIMKDNSDAVGRELWAVMKIYIGKMSAGRRWYGDTLLKN